MPEQSPQSHAYSTATTRLRNAHDAEFRQILAEEYAVLGLTYVAKLTQEQKAARDLADATVKAMDKVAQLVEQYGPAVLKHPSLRPYVGTNHPWGGQISTGRTGATWTKMGAAAPPAEE